MLMLYGWCITVPPGEEGGRASMSRSSTSTLAGGLKGAFKGFTYSEMIIHKHQDLSSILKHLKLGDSEDPEPLLFVSRRWTREVRERRVHIADFGNLLVFVFSDIFHIHLIEESVWHPR